MRRYSPCPTVTLALVFLAGCTGGEPDDRAGSVSGAADQPPASAGDTVENPPLPPAPAQPPPPRPDTRQDSIMLEGMPEPVTLRLVESPPGFALPFTTYVPEDILFETHDAAGGEAVRFIANFAGSRNNDVYLEVFAYPEGTTQAEANAAARGVAEALGLRTRDSDTGDRFDWSIEEYDFMQQRPSGETIVGAVALGSHAGRFFRVVVHYPPVYGDGFGPRTHRILQEWRWEDTGEMLGER